MADMTHSLTSRSAAERVAAVRELAAQLTASSDRTTLLLKALDDKSNLVIAAAVDALTKELPGNSIPLLTARYWWLAEDGIKRDSGCVARIAIVKALVAGRVSEAAEVFHHAIVSYQPERVGLGMDDTAVALRGQAAGAMAELRIPHALLALSILLFDVEPRVPHAPEERLYVNMATRVAAARSLAALGETGGVAALGVRMTHGEQEVPEVLVECMDAIAALDPEAGLQVISPYLKSAIPYLVAGAATALAGLPSLWHNQVIACLTDACAKAKKETLEPLTLALASIRSDAAVPALAYLTDHQETSVRLAAIAGLAQRADAAAIAVIRNVSLRKGDKVVVMEAKAALELLAPTG